MKTFIYTSAERRRHHDTLYSVTVYRVVKNKPVLVGSIDGSYVTVPYLVLEVLRSHKQLPASAFERNPSGSPKHLPNLMKDAGIADVIAV